MRRVLVVWVSAVAMAVLLVGMVMVSVGGAATTVSTTVTIAASADTYVAQSAKTTNFGSALTMTTGGAANKVKRVYLRFIVSGVPANATVVGARIVLTALNSSGVKPTLKKQTVGTWTESTVTWSNAPAVGTTITSPPAVQAGPVTYQVQNVVKSNGTFSFVLVQGSSKETNWATRESANPPALIL